MLRYRGGSIGLWLALEQLSLSFLKGLILFVVPQEPRSRVVIRSV